MKPMLATDYDPSKVRFPCGVQPKIDGVRALSPGGKFTGRSLKPFGNRHTTQFFSQPEYANLDGELAAHDEHHPDLCRITTSATGTHDGQPFLLWHVFDLLTPEAVARPYEDRYAMLQQHVSNLQMHAKGLHLRVVPMDVVYNAEELEIVHARNLNDGFEGSIIRDLKGLHKQGRSTVREMGLLRIKDFVDFECVVTAITEGRTNTNEAFLNELGQTERSTHQENMLPNGMVGNLTCTIINDVYDTTLSSKPLLFKKGQVITVGPGRMPHDKRREFLEHPERLLQEIIKVKMFPKGIKDKPRFPTYQSHRSRTDMST